MIPELPAGWRAALADEVDRPFFAELRDFVERERRAHEVFPAPEDTFAALELTPLASVRAVILGQDPYHGAGQAHGLAFSVRKNVAIPPSLRNILRELRDDLGFDPPRHGDLSAWGRRGVLLLNTVLTVRSAEAGSHRGRGWERFTDAVIRVVAEHDPESVGAGARSPGDGATGAAGPGTAPVAFLLWGNAARAKRTLMGDRHVVVEGAHPSPLSAHRGFLGSRPFSRANAALAAAGGTPIDWRLSPS